MQIKNTKNKFPGPIVVWTDTAGNKYAAQQTNPNRVIFAVSFNERSDKNGVPDANGNFGTSGWFTGFGDSLQIQPDTQHKIARGEYRYGDIPWIEQRELSTAAREQNPNPERSLSDAISYPDRVQIDDETRAKLLALLTKRCRQSTVRAIDRALKHPADLKNCGLFGRLEIAPTVSYCAGQDYPSEIATLRKLLINN